MQNWKTSSILRAGHARALGMAFFFALPDDGGFWSRWVVFARGTVLVVSGQSVRVPSIGPPRFYRPGVGGRRAAT
jgi:hypothetical protein